MTRKKQNGKQPFLINVLSDAAGSPLRMTQKADFLCIMPPQINAIVDDPVVRTHWHVVGKSVEFCSSQLHPRVLLGEDLVLWRADGRLLAWQDLCIHRGIKLSLGRIREDCAIQCAYHGWTYNSEGKCNHIPAHPDLEPPAKARVKTFHVEEHGGLVWVNLAKEPPPFTGLAEFSDPAFRKVLSGPYDVAAGATRVIENFLDVAHLPFVHEGLLGVSSRAEIEDYTVDRTGDGLIARNIRIFQPNPDGLNHGAQVSYDYGVVAPFAVFLRKHVGDHLLTIFFSVTPRSPLASCGWCLIMMNYGHDVPESEIAGFQDAIFEQDRQMVESQRPERLPLDLSAELHLRSDRLAIAYRQYLREKGLQFGCE